MTIMSASPATRNLRQARSPGVPLAQRNAQLRRTVAQLTRELTTARFEATHDALTGLLNRAGFAGLWPTLTPSGLLLVDLDGFKPVNDRFGHLAGDLVLTVIGARLAGTTATVARLGGDEFVIASSDVNPTGFAFWIAGLIGAPIDLPDGQTVTVTASIGVYPVTGSVEVYQAIEKADRAMYAAKNGSNTVEVFTPTLPDASDQGIRRRDASKGEWLAPQPR